MTLGTLGCRAVALAAVLLLPTAARAQQVQVPPTRSGDQSDDYFGTRVADPYRWLEDDTSAETGAWVEAQNRVTFAYLAAIPQRDGIKRRLTTVWNYERFSTPFREGGRYFFFKNDGLQNQSVLYTQGTLTGSPRVVLDPNTFSTDGTVALSTLAVSPDAHLLVYGTSTSGSDWQEFMVREVDTGRDRPDHLRWIKFSGASWSKDGKGFFYSRYPAPQPGQVLTQANRNQTLYYHRVGTDQVDDILVYQRPEQPEWSFGASVTEDGRYSVINVGYGTSPRNRVYYQELGKPGRPDVQAPLIRLLDDFDASYDFVGNDGPVFYFLTDNGAPKRRLIAIDTRRPERERWQTVIPEAGDVLQSVSLIDNIFVTLWLMDAHSLLRLYGLDGRLLGELELPGIGTVSGISGRRADREMFYTFTSFLYPATVFRYDFKRGASTVFKAAHVDFDASRYVTEQVFFASKDGTRIPMFLTHRRDLVRDGNNPTYLTAYGGFDISILPGFSPSYVVWLEMGGMVAVPNLRGGGEYGEEWHEAGMLERKQNVFDDFIAAAEYLVSERYTSPAKLAIGGGSNGGLLIGAVVNQRPDLFGVALPAVGVMDMLRYHRFTIGWAWVNEYGSADSASQFPFLYAYSPLHNIKPGVDYPATMVTTGDHDDRVVPAHSFKYAAALQAATLGRRPVLIRIETKAGHGGGKPTTKVIEEQADRWAFVVTNLGMGGLVP